MNSNSICNQKIVIAGGTGFIGQHLAKWFASTNQIIILTRSLSGSASNKYSEKNAIHYNIRYVHWDGKTQGEWSKEIDGCGILINLSGKSVNCRYNEKNKQEIFDSRTYSTKAIGEAIRQVAHPPALWINAASATIYRHADTARRMNIPVNSTMISACRHANNGRKLSLTNQHPKLAK